MIQLWNPWASCLRDLIEKRLRNSFGSKKLCKTKLTVPFVLMFLLYIYVTESVLDLSQSFDERENIRDRNGYIYENIKKIKNIRLAINQA